MEWWSHSPWNPANNINYTAVESGFALEYLEHPGKNLQPSFYTIPSMENNTLIRMENNTLIRGYQEAFVDKMLSYSLSYDNVLYCMDNETDASPQWGTYWAKYIKSRAAEARVEVEMTEMWGARTLNDPKYNNTVNHPDIYSFIEISQVNHNQNRAHWDSAGEFITLNIERVLGF